MKKQMTILCLSVAWLCLPGDVLLAKKSDKPEAQMTSVQKPLPLDHPFYKSLVTTYNTSTTLQSAARDIYASAENISQALAGWRPSLNLTTGATRQGQEDQITSFSNVPPFSAISPRSYSTSYQTALEMNYNLYAGGATVAGTDAARATVAAQIAAYVNAEQKVLSDSVKAYIDLYLKKATLDLRDKNVVTKKKTLDQARARMEVGELTLTDVSQAEANYAAALADQISAKSDVATAKAVFNNAVGEAPPEKLPLPDPITLYIPVPVHQGEFVEVSLKNNPAIVNASLSAKAARSNVDVAQGSLLPSVNLRSSLGRNLTSDTVNAADARVNSASIGVSVSVPIYGNGGSDWSKFRAARQTARSAKLTLEGIKADARQNAITLWDTWTSARDQLPGLEAQVEAARLALEGVQQESLVGERTLIEVLDAEDRLLQAELALLQTRTQYLQAGFQLLTSEGQLTAASLNLPVEAYALQSRVDQIEGTWIGTGADANFKGEE